MKEIVEEKIEKLQVFLESIELKIHRRILKKEDEKEFTPTHTN